ncbi:AraC family transcriptional regulator ligand-binding domain-containing protein [Shimia sp.]|uniref:AraC family transcriptional regulator n=1 Tax=Shimia sp. TaxID=1954381 RepID=UPI003296F9EA
MAKNLNSKKQTRYTISESTTQACAMLGIQTPRVLRRAGLPDDIISNEGRGVTGAQFFDLWNAVIAECDQPNLPLEMAKVFSRGPFDAALFAFSCSPNIAVGLERLAVFKPLVAPIKLSLRLSERAISVDVTAGEPGLVMPATMAAFHLAHLIEISRTSTGVDVVPLKVGLPELMPEQAVYDRHFGRPAIVAAQASLTFSREDAHRPLISENPELWAGFERDLTRQLAEQRRNTAVSIRVRNALLELLPSGQSSVDAVCARLLMSRRSLQRHLKAEGETFQGILDATREDLSLHYLRAGALSVEEISYLLAYRDPNSFYRAFQGWTGQTPAQVRRA